LDKKENSNYFASRRNIPITYRPSGDDENENGMLKQLSSRYRSIIWHKAKINILYIQN